MSERQLKCLPVTTLSWLLSAISLAVILGIGIRCGRVSEALFSKARFGFEDLSSASSKVVIQVPTDIQPRLNLKDLVDNLELRPQLDLLIQAYTRIQERLPSSPLSYFQIAGIHGQPYQAWDGVNTADKELSQIQEPIGGLQSGLLDTFAGYCWHASILFPTWHRAYTLLMEQELRREAVQIAQTYEKANRKVYLKAADRLRMPFWDWTGDDAAQNGLPGYVLQDQVEIMTPKGVRLVRNPLKGYVFQGDVAEGNAGISRGGNADGKKVGYAPSLQDDQVLRHPDINLQPDEEGLQEDLRSEISAYVRPAWEHLITDPEIAQSWALFSTHRSRHDGLRPESTVGDLEGLHDLIHDVLGGIVFEGEVGYPGHASDTNVAAFDPLFFMHHAQLDRLVAIFQRKNPRTWIEETHERHVKNYMVGLHGTVSNSSTPLWPFRKSLDSFYTSDDVREFTSLGYTYPDFENRLEEVGHQKQSDPESYISERWWVFSY